jgi:hypothetical protein
MLRLSLLHGHLTVLLPLLFLLAANFFWQSFLNLWELLINFQ